MSSAVITGFVYSLLLNSSFSESIGQTRQTMRRNADNRDIRLEVVSKDRLLKATRQLLNKLSMLDEDERKDYSLILAEGLNRITVRELLAEVTTLVEKKREEKHYLRHLELQQ